MDKKKQLQQSLAEDPLQIPKQAEKPNDYWGSWPNDPTFKLFGQFSQANNPFYFYGEEFKNKQCVANSLACLLFVVVHFSLPPQLWTKLFINHILLHGNEINLQALRKARNNEEEWNALEEANYYLKLSQIPTTLNAFHHRVKLLFIDT